MNSLNLSRIVIWRLPGRWEHFRHERRMTSHDGKTYLACLITNQLQIVIEGSKLPSSLNPAFFLTTFRSDRYVVYCVTWIVTRCQIIIIMCSKLAQRTRLEMRVFMVEWWEQLHCTTYSHSACEGGRERELYIDLDFLPKDAIVASVLSSLSLFTVSQA